MSMRRAPAPEGPLLSPSWSSSFSKKYGVHQMLESPMPSPALPSIVPQHGKKHRPNYLRRALRWLLPLAKWLCGLLVVCCVLRASFHSNNIRLITDSRTLDGKYRLIDDDVSLQGPTPVIIANPKGGSKYSFSLPKHLAYPLKPSEYANICSQSDNLTRRLRYQSGHSGSSQNRGIREYYYTDPNFMDVKEAEDYELLPIKPNHETHQSLMEEESKRERAGSNGEICEKTLTYVLETTDAGIGNTLMRLWLSYGLAKKEGRAFFIDDSNWSYGKYTDLFVSPPSPSCLPAPPHHRLPCPHEARHLLISSSTSQWAFGTAFREHFKSRKKPESQEEIFTLLRTGYEALFHLAPQDATYATARLAELEDLRAKGSRIAGLHVRRGNRHPWESQYRDSYIPLETYVDTANTFITLEFHPNALNSSVVPQSDKSSPELESVILLASDDPDLYGAQELLGNARRAQSHISLANKAALDAASPTMVSQSSDTEVIFNRFIEGNVGWEGGFFPSVFWGLGNAAAGSAAARGLREEREDPPPSELSLSLRGLVARAYLLDLKILGASDAVVCGVSSTGCRLLAVMLGWQKGVVEGRWKNVDGAFGWTAFEEDEMP